MRTPVALRPALNGEQNRLRPEDRPVHEWYRFVLSFPPHLVRTYLEQFGLEPGQRVLDPFCGTGTTLVEAKKMGVSATGLEANPMPCFASRVKLDWTPDADGLEDHAEQVAAAAYHEIERAGFGDDVDLSRYADSRDLFTLSPDRRDLLLTDSISPLPLHKALVLLRCLDSRRDERFVNLERLALAKSVIQRSSNLHFGPEVGVGPAKQDAPVIGPWLAGVRAMADDLRALRGRPPVPSEVHAADAREVGAVLPQGSIDGVITSPPYPNEKDYTRTTRLESVLLGFISSKAELRSYKKGLLRSNTRGVYISDTDDLRVATHPEIARIAEEIESRRMAMGKTSGFERLYARVTRLYFGGMVRHLEGLRSVLRPGARLAYVVGDQASYLRVMIRTGADPGGAGTAAWLRRGTNRSLSHPSRHGHARTTARRGPGAALDRQATTVTEKPQNRYAQVIEHIFRAHFHDGMERIPFQRADIERACEAIGIPLPKNFGGHSLLIPLSDFTA